MRGATASLATPPPRLGGTSPAGAPACRAQVSRGGAGPLAGVGQCKDATDARPCLFIVLRVPGFARRRPNPRAIVRLGSTKPLPQPAPACAAARRQ